MKIQTGFLVASVGVFALWAVGQERVRSEGEVWAEWNAGKRGASVTTTKASATAPATQTVIWPVEVVGVVGLAQVRATENDPWMKAQVGMKLGKQAEVRTGPRSELKLRTAEGKEVLVDRLGRHSAEELIQRPARVKTDLGLQYGRVRYDIQAAGMEHDATIHTPGRTLSRPGTRVGVIDTRPSTRPTAAGPVERSLGGTWLDVWAERIEKGEKERP